MSTCSTMSAMYAVLKHARDIEDKVQQAASKLHSFLGQDKKHYFHMPGDCSRMVNYACGAFDANIKDEYPGLTCTTFWVQGYLGITSAAYDFLKFPKFRYYHEALLISLGDNSWVYDPTWLQFDRFHLGLPLFDYASYRAKWITISLEHNLDKCALEGDPVFAAYNADLEGIALNKDKFYWIKRVLMASGTPELLKSMFDPKDTQFDLNLLPKNEKLMTAINGVEFNNIGQIEFSVDTFNDYCEIPINGIIYTKVANMEDCPLYEKTVFIEDARLDPITNDDNSMFFGITNSSDMILIINAYLHAYLDYAKTVIQEDFEYTLTVKLIDNPPVDTVGD